MARPGKPAPPPPPPPDDEPVAMAPKERDFKKPTTKAIEGMGMVGTPPTVRVGFDMKYGLNNYGSIGFHVAAEIPMMPVDQGDLHRTFDRAYQEVARAFNERDREIRRALGRRIKDPPTEMETT